MRRDLVTGDPRVLQPHDHTAWCGDGTRDLHHAAARAFSAAADRNEMMLFVGDDPRVDWLTELDDAPELIERGALSLTTVAEAYAAAGDPAQQRAHFQGLIEQALLEGYSGLCVVADNTVLAAGSKDDFEAWLAWEAAADELQATEPLSGVCFFDRTRVPEQRLSDLATMHPVRHDALPEPPFRIFAGSDVLRVLGELDGMLEEQLRRVIGAAAASTGRDLDLSEVEFVNHRALLALDEIARGGVAVRLTGTKDIVDRLWELVRPLAPALEFC